MTARIPDDTSAMPARRAAPVQREADARDIDASAAAGCALAVKHAEQAMLDAYSAPGPLPAKLKKAR